MMTDVKQVEADLDFIRRSVERSRAPGSPGAIYGLWAVLSLVGFALIDFAPHLVGRFWLVASPLGFVLSMYLGWRHSRATGQLARTEGIRHAMHWLALPVAIFLAVPLGVSGAIAWQPLAQLFVLMIAMVYFLAGVHLDRPLLWVSAVLLASYFALFFLPAYRWTVVGAAVAFGLLATAFFRWRQPRGQPN